MHKQGYSQPPDTNDMENAFLLKASLLDTTGVGCFAAEPIEEGTRLYLPGENTNRHLDIDEIPDSHLKYCPLLESGKFLAPANFAMMSVFWYINHNREPNVVADKWRLFARRNIEPNEELTLFYPDLLTHPKNKAWVVPGIHY